MSDDAADEREAVVRYLRLVGEDRAADAIEAGEHHHRATTPPACHACGTATLQRLDVKLPTGVVAVPWCGDFDCEVLMYAEPTKYAGGTP